MSAFDKARDKFEKEAQDIYNVSSEHGIQASIAISLKRIADAMERTNEYGEFGSEAISGSIRRGLMQQG